MIRPQLSEDIYNIKADYQLDKEQMGLKAAAGRYLFKHGGADFAYGKNSYYWIKV